MKIKLIPDGRQLGNITRYYVSIIILMLSMAMIRSISPVQILDIIILDSPIFLASSTIIILIWAGLHKYSDSTKIMTYLYIMCLPPSIYAFCTWISITPLDVIFCGHLILFSVLTYVFSYIEYYKQHAMLPIYNTIMLTSLNNKLKPHFLFNSINTILGIIRDDTKLAERLLEDLSDIFRCFAADTKYTYTFQEDIDIALKYLDIENTRTGHNINFKQEIEPATSKIEVPFLLLQPLIENSIHYGLVTYNQNGYLKLTSSIINNFLVISIENTINSAAPKKGTGTTLNNLKKRLSIMYDVNSFFEVTTTNTLFKLTIKIPNIKS